MATILRMETTPHITMIQLRDDVMYSNGIAYRVDAVSRDMKPDVGDWIIEKIMEHLLVG
jgi:hypothetical protein